jgi:APA family basic amino acid/polyamine antiporter
MLASTENTQNQNRKIGFWSLTSLVAGSQIGSGIFLIPASLAVFGAIGLSSWLITAVGALLLALVFSKLSSEVSKTGGPHTFIEAAFGKTFGFFSAWTYWVISWVSTPIVIISVVTYLSPLWGQQTPFINFILEIIILFFITALNLAGVNRAGRAEFIFTLLKLLPLLLVPLFGLFFIKLDHFIPFNPSQEPNLQVLNAAALLTLWGFIGLECATAPADEVKNPKKTIPMAIVTGTLIVAFVYIFSSFVVMGVVPPQALMNSKAPFADAASIIFGGNWSVIISVAASIVCLGTLNAWILTSGQIALGAAHDGHFPQFFKTKNKAGAPFWGLIISSLGIVPILFLMLDLSLVDQINSIIDISVTAFLFIYFLSVLSYLQFLWKKLRMGSSDFWGILIGLGALTFCLWALYASGIRMLACATFIPLAGIPFYLWNRRKNLSEPKELLTESNRS